MPVGMDDGSQLAFHHPLGFTSLPLRDVLLSMAFGLACVALCAGRSLLRPLLECRVMLFLGLISYSFYLLHQNTAWYGNEWLKKFSPVEDSSRLAILCTVGFAVVVLISYLFFRLFERPFLKARKIS